eukprot:GHVS01045968.1.p1 GENE.GHVS01045968.1~~GHVS01045968.1.p1  ORF type:complete len:103 (-),score=2.63 GHVS01045968.1:152-460(-)
MTSQTENLLGTAVLCFALGLFSYSVGEWRGLVPGSPRGYPLGALSSLFLSSVSLITGTLYVAKATDWLAIFLIIPVALLVFSVFTLSMFLIARLPSKAVKGN